MAIRIYATLDTKAMLRSAASFGLTARELDRAAASAINDVAKTNRNVTRREVRAYVNLPASSVNPRIQQTERATPQKLKAVVTIGVRRSASGSKASDRPSLISFGGKPNKPRKEAKRTKTGKLTKSARAPFSYQIVKGGPRRILPGGFVQRPYSSRGGTSRPPLAFMRDGRSRYPMLVPKGPSIPAIYQATQQNRVAANVHKEMEGRLPSRLQGQAQRIYDRRWRKVAN